MSIIEFLRERIVFLIINILILIFTGVLLKSLGVDSYPIIFILFINIIGILIFHIYDYIKRRNYSVISSITVHYQLTVGRF